MSLMYLNLQNLNRDSENKQQTLHCTSIFSPATVPELAILVAGCLGGHSILGTADTNMAVPCMAMVSMPRCAEHIAWTLQTPSACLCLSSEDENNGDSLLKISRKAAEENALSCVVQAGHFQGHQRRLPERGRPRPQAPSTPCMRDAMLLPLHQDARTL
jgi:hypothetical protein